MGCGSSVGRGGFFCPRAAVLAGSGRECDTGHKRPGLFRLLSRAWGSAFGSGSLESLVKSWTLITPQSLFPAPRRTRRGRISPPDRRPRPVPRRTTKRFRPRRSARPRAANIDGLRMHRRARSGAGQRVRARRGHPFRQGRRRRRGRYPGLILPPVPGRRCYAGLEGPAAAL